MEGSNLQAMVLGPSPGTCFLQYTVEESLLMHVLPVVALVLPQHKLLWATLLCFSLALESLLARTCPPQVPPNPFNEPPFPWVFTCSGSVDESLGLSPIKAPLTVQCAQPSPQESSWSHKISNVISLICNLEPGSSSQGNCFVIKRQTQINPKNIWPFVMLRMNLLFSSNAKMTWYSKFTMLFQYCNVFELKNLTLIKTLLFGRSPNPAQQQYLYSVTSCCTNSITNPAA